MAQKLFALFVALITVSFIACGSHPDPIHGDDNDDEDTSLLRGADIELLVDPPTVGLGEKILVRVTIENINPDGALFIVRYPSERLHYVEETSLLEVDGESVSIDPVEGPLSSNDK